MSKHSVKHAWETCRNNLGDPGEHLEVWVLERYYRGRLSPEDRARVRRHVVLCRECRDLLLDLVRFLEDDGREGRVWSAEVAAAWDDWQDELKKSEQEAAARDVVEQVTT